ncbi:MAG: glycosyltransferase family 4 protein [Paracoccaceae bacterium]|nr:glycosyltransferase family 4 protein [Paracoccaceae bacterium]
MRVSLITLDGLFPPAHGGAHVLQMIAQGLAELGHDVSCLIRLADEDASDLTDQTVAGLAASGLRYSRSSSGVVRFKSGALSGAGVIDAGGRFLPFVLSELRRTGAETVIMSDIGGRPAHTLLSVIAERFTGMLVYAPQTVHFLPGGPLAVQADPAATKAMRLCRVVVPSQYLAAYLRQHLGIAARVNLPPLFALSEVPPRPQPFGGPVGVFNPNTWKGLPILLALADRRPDLQFLVRCGWRTLHTERDALSQRGNVIIEDHSHDGGTVYDQASIILVPSLCYESLGLVSIEAMLRGLPVVSARHGGLAEAGLGTAVLCTAVPIVFEDDRKNPGGHVRQHVPEQPLDDWLAAIDRLTNDRAWYEQRARHAIIRSHAFARSLTWESTERSFLG